MPKKGWTCETCAGDCCVIVSIEGEKAPELKQGPMDYSLKELKALGYREIYHPHTSCAVKTDDGCLIYENRPKLCRSYYCHGKYWRPKA